MPFSSLPFTQKGEHLNTSDVPTFNPIYGSKDIVNPRLRRKPFLEPRRFIDAIDLQSIGILHSKSFWHLKAPPGNHETTRCWDGQIEGPKDVQNKNHILATMSGDLLPFLEWLLSQTKIYQKATMLGSSWYIFVEVSQLFSSEPSVWRKKKKKKNLICQSPVHSQEARIESKTPASESYEVATLRKALYNYGFPIGDGRSSCF